MLELAPWLAEAFSSLVRQAAAHPQKDMVPAPDLVGGWVLANDVAVVWRWRRHAGGARLHGRILP